MLAIFETVLGQQASSFILYSDGVVVYRLKDVASLHVVITQISDQVENVWLSVTKYQLEGHLA